MQPRPDALSRVRGCLLGGAVGDALGAPVEFMSLGEIRRVHGGAGILEFAPAYDHVGAVTDDTQMTLFTAEGLIRAQVRYAGRGICHPPSVIHHALLRWLHTQGETSPAFPKFDDAWPDGWLVQRKELHARRAPGMTCLSALKASKQFGDEARNDSKGCGAIMRIAPIGLFVRIDDHLTEGTAPLAFTMACESAKHTHGHVSSTLASGFFSLVIGYLLKGVPLIDAISLSKGWVERAEDSQEVMAAIDGALAMAASNVAATAETVELLGAGWVAEESLGIALFCALRAESFEHGVRLAVNHGGDSDSTGSLTGQLLGTLWGVDSIPNRWVDQVELRDVIEELARDLVGVTQGESEVWAGRYPGW
ncbi:MAG TPA: ADP-ribosylglycohydrolase family protein [Polyangiaceae bacterium]|nr:ADP-ribosylglycohydrolase family protein [Polyangiaceae bacterium]